MSMQSNPSGTEPIIGADPPEPPRTAADWSAVQQEAMGNPQPPAQQTQEQPPAAPEARYTQEDLERVRREEKDKLYQRIEGLTEQVKTIAEEREERLAAEKKAADEAKAEQKRQEEEAMSAKELLAQKEREWSERFTSLEKTYEADKAVFEMERRLTELEQYQQARISQESEYIMPELRDLIRGNSESEIDASIEEMKSRTAQIMGNITQGAQVERQQMRGAAPTAPPVGPLEQAESYESITPEDIRSMDMETYKKHRASLLNASGRAYRGYN